jgi:hypothetical protein
MGWSAISLVLRNTGMGAALIVCSCALPHGEAQTGALASVHSPNLRGQLPLTRFYDTPPLLSGRPGDLIRAEPFDRYDLPPGASALRILYHSLSAGGQDVASSGVVLVPNGTSPPSGWPVIAWAHGILGTARMCAPSLDETLHSGSLLSMYLNLGYAVVATDYVGLGTAFRNASIDTWSNATDVIYSIQAARKAFPRLSPSWVAAGEGDGGTAVLKVAELESQRHDPGYLGSVAISGTFALSTASVNLSPKTWEDRLVLLAYGIKTVSPQFSIEEIFTARGLARYRDLTQACSGPSEAPALLTDEMLKAGWENNAFVQNFVKSNTLGLEPADAPLLLISAGEPQAAPSKTARVVALLCRQGDHVDLENYPGADSEHVVGDSAANQLAWIKAVFQRRVTPNHCP